MIYGSVIAAISTPSGKGGVAVIRISGDGAVKIAEKIFFPKSKKPLSNIPARYQTYGDIIYNSEYIDDGMATVFYAPASYTGEDTVEISCHGGILVTRRVLEALLRAGATPAEAGEFTRRAFINGKISLTDAEAIGSLLDAKSNEQAKLYSASSRSLLSGKIDEVRKILTDILSSVFARIDYPDEDLGDFGHDEMLKMLNSAKVLLSTLLATYPTGKAISEGVRTVICGKPNVGKSSLYNLILGEDAAIVTEIEGTTRDLLSRQVPLGRVMLNLFDTAGIREDDSADHVEKIGIQRSVSAINDAELVVTVFDASRPLDARDLELVQVVAPRKVPKIAVINKTDLGKKLDTSPIVNSFDAIVEISVEGDGLSAMTKLKSIIEGLFTSEKIATGCDAILSSARQNSALKSALAYVESALAAEKLGIYTDAVASEVEKALGAVAEADGRAVSETVVSDIFSKFCVGK